MIIFGGGDDGGIMGIFVVKMVLSVVGGRKGVFGRGSVVGV